MWRGSAIAMACMLASCAYVSKKEFDELWDQDSDGWNDEEDCADDNANIFPFAPDVRGDLCDADCGKEADADGDDWPDDADCDPNDFKVFPCAPEVSLVDDIDNDCDGDPGTETNEKCNDEQQGFNPAFGLDPDFPPSPSAVFPEPEQTQISLQECGFPSQGVEE